MSNTITINGETYVKQSTGNRAVVVVDRGWIFAGDVTEANGRIILTNAVWILNWNEIGFDGMLKDPKSSKVKLRRMDHAVDLPGDSEIFRIPVSAEWGL